MTDDNLNAIRRTLLAIPKASEFIVRPTTTIGLARRLTAVLMVVDFTLSDFWRLLPRRGSA